MKILVVEDDSFVADDLKDKLEQLEYRVTAIVESYKEALEAVERERPDLALLDIELKGELSGIDLAEKLARLGIPYIYLTGLRDINTYLRAKNSQPQRYLSKPIDLYNLRNAILDIDLSKTPASTTLLHFINKDGNKERIDPNDIVYVKASNVYCDIHFVDESRSTLSIPMGEFVEKLDWPDVIRISRSYAVNLKHIRRLRGNEVEMIFGDPIRITDSYKEILNSHLKMY